MKRREFIATVLAAIGAAFGVRALDYRWEDNLYVFVIDVRKCIGCGRCVAACKIENDVPPKYFRTWIERYSWIGYEVEVDSPNGGINGFDVKQADKSYFVPKLCNHCENPPCVQVCPVGATYKTPDGVVLVDEKYCIGCRYCIQACPYGARYLYPPDGPKESRRNTADKCTWCYHRIVKGQKPVCVEVCPTNARNFGNLKDPDDPIHEMFNERLSVLKPEQGTKPKVFYIGIDSEVR